nr:TMEM43 family protein [uncultured Gellertiella sp.]
MSYTETTTQSWFSRIKTAIFMIFFGFILVVASGILLFWNEGRAIGTYRALVEGAGLVISVPAETPDPANEGKLVHISGTVVPGAVAEDQQFSISADGAVGLSRSVDMYQWVQKEESKTQKNLGGSEETVTTYTYSKEWNDSRVKSEDFKQADGHQNPDMPVSGQTFEVPDARVGGFTVAGDQVAPLGKSNPVQLTADDAARFASFFGTDRPVKAENGGLFVGANPSSPSVGDLRISYSRADLKDASFVARQSGEALAPYQASNGNEIFLSAAGKVDAAGLFKQAEETNAIITWLLRLAGIVCLFIGFAMIFSIFGVLADLIPFFGSLVGFGTSLIAFVLALIIGPFIIALGWFAYRPLLALAIMGTGVVLGGGIWYLRRNRGTAASVASAQKA